ncbi:18410_t:CDS:2, partial [Racocetra persica]
MNNKYSIFEVGLEEDTSDVNESQKSKNESIVSETNSKIDKSVEENSEIDKSVEENSKIDENAAERQVQNYMIEVGFNLVKCHLEKNKHGEIIYYTFEYKNSGKYQAKKNANNEDICECKNAKMNCSWRVNFNLSGGAVYITLLNEVHNHSLYKNIQDISSKHRYLSTEIFKKVEFL